MYKYIYFCNITFTHIFYNFLQLSRYQRNIILSLLLQKHYNTLSVALVKKISELLFIISLLKHSGQNTVKSLI